MTQTPRIVFSPLGRRWYVVTRYREKRGVDPQTGKPYAYLVASRKFDVTDQMKAILKTKPPTLYTPSEPEPRNKRKVR